MKLWIADRSWDLETYRPVDRQWSQPWSLAWQCPHCGRQWAKATTGHRWFFITNPCEECPGGILDVPGSLLLGNTHGSFDETLPLELWKREVELHLRWKEKQE